MRTLDAIRFLLLVLLLAWSCATVSGCANSSNADRYGYDSSVGQQEAETIATEAEQLKQALGPSSPHYQRVVRLAETANRHRDRMRRVKVYIVTLRALLDD